MGDDTPAPTQSATAQLPAISPIVIQILQRLEALAEQQGQAAVRQEAMLAKLGQVIAQLNKHSLFIVQHERALAKCVSCANYVPQDPLADTRQVNPHDLIPHDVVYPLPADAPPEASP